MSALKISDSERIKIKKQLCRAVELRDSGQLMVAEQILQNMASKYSDYWPPYLFLGDIYDDLERYQEAEDMFQKVVTIKPNYDLASRTLFHALWDLGKEKEALEEIRRFLSVADWNDKKAKKTIMEDYQDILQELLSHKDYQEHKETVQKLLSTIEKYKQV